MGIIMESKADAIRKCGVGGNVSVAVAAPAEPAVESESAAVDSQEEIPADVTEAAVSDSSGEVAADPAPAPAEEVAGDVVPAEEEAPVEAAPAVEEPQPEPKSKRVVRGARNVRKKR